MDHQSAMAIKSLEDDQYIQDYYEFHEVLGQGSFGQVRAAKHIGTNVECAIKIIDKVKLVKKQDSSIYFDLLKSEIKTL